MKNNLQVPEENVASGSYRELQIEPDFYLLQASNEASGAIRLDRPVDQLFIQFHFCLQGHARFLFHGGRYVMDLPRDQSVLLYNPETRLHLQAILAPDTRLISLLIPIGKFHSLFSAEAAFIPFLRQGNLDKKYYQQHPVLPTISVILTQLWNEQLHPSVRALYCKGKIYELLSLYFNRNETQAEQCPFLMDEENVRRIRRAKEIIIERMTEPPGLQELAGEIGLSLKKLKEGFRQIYGDSVYSFLFDYKMETARKMMETGKYNVNEVGLKIGYSTASHFIAAFKKKYNTTPKQYLLSLAQQRA